jgi:hypothetical protein
MTIVSLRHPFFSAFVVCITTQVNSEHPEESVLPSQQQYGTEVSWPMQRHAASSSPSYLNYMQGCYATYNQEQCDENEAERIAINAAQPSVQRNFTSAGYAKVQAPWASYTALRQFWDLYQADYQVTEDWDDANVYTNHWESATQTLRVDAPDGPRMTVPIRRKLVEEVQSVLEKWTGVPLQPTSLYGIRSYSAGSILAPHVDR